MPHVRTDDRAPLAAWLAATGRPAQADPAYVSESDWAEYLHDRLAAETETAIAIDLPALTGAQAMDTTAGGKTAQLAHMLKDALAGMPADQTILVVAHDPAATAALLAAAGCDSPRLQVVCPEDLPRARTIHSTMTVGTTPDILPTPTEETLLGLFADRPRVYELRDEPDMRERMADLDRLRLEIPTKSVKARRGQAFDHRTANENWSRGRRR